VLFACLAGQPSPRLAATGKRPETGTTRGGDASSLVDPRNPHRRGIAAVQMAWTALYLGIITARQDTAFQPRGLFGACRHIRDSFAQYRPHAQPRPHSSALSSFRARGNANVAPVRRVSRRSKCSFLSDDLHPLPGLQRSAAATPATSWKIKIERRFSLTPDDTLALHDLRKSIADFLWGSSSTWMKPSISSLVSPARNQPIRRWAA